MAGAAIKKAELSILLTTDREIQRINEEWRGKNKPTDVLSFPLLTPEELKSLNAKSPEWEMGDIVISLDRARAQSKEHQVTLLQELDLLLVHGLLHLLGFDHEFSPKEERRMRAWEKKLMGRKGLL